MSNLLTTYPVDVLPETWALNDHFLAAIERRMQLWKRHGYSWKFGQEHEFILYTPKEFEDAKCDPKYPDWNDYKISNPSLGPSIDLYRRIKANPNSDYAKKAISRLIGYVKRAKDIPGFVEEVKMKPDEIIAHLREYQKNLASDDPKVASLALSNAYLSFLHLMPHAEGGIRDLIKPTFGSFAYGIGWWDNAGVCEARTRPIKSVTKLISTSHKLIPTVLATAEKFGVIPCFDGVGAHLHTSLWHEASGRNVMELKTEEDRAMYERVLTGLYTVFSEGPHLINDFDAKNFSHEVDLGSGHLRGDTFRQTGTTLELRRGHQSGFVHQARDIAMILGAAAYGAFEIKDLEAHKKEKRITLEWRECPLVSNRFVGSTSVLQRLLEASWIGKDGHIIPNITAVNRYYGPLKDELGYNHLEDFRYKRPKSRIRKGISLYKADTWAEMLKTIRIDADNTIHISHLSPAIQELFKPLTITGRKHVLVGHYKRTQYGIVPLQAHLDKAKPTPALDYALGQKAVATAATHFKAALDDKAVQSGEILASRLQRKMHRFSNDPDATPEDIRASLTKDIWEDLINPVLWQHGIHGADKEPDDDEKLPDDLWAGIKADKTTIKSVRPHFKAAVEARIEKLRQNGNNNYLIALMHDALGFIDTDLLDLPAYIEKLAKDALIQMEHGFVLGHPTYRLRRSLDHFKTSVMGVFTMAITEPGVSLDDLDAMATRTREKLEAVINAERVYDYGRDPKNPLNNKKGVKPRYISLKRRNRLMTNSYRRTVRIVGPMLLKDFDQQREMLVELRKVIEGKAPIPAPAMS